MMLTEDRLRAYMKCPAFFHYGGTVELPLKTAIIEMIYIQMTLALMKYAERWVYQDLLSRCIEQFPRRMDLDPAEHNIPVLQKDAAIIIDELFQVLQPKMYIPIFGPYQQPIQISRSHFTPRIAAVLHRPINTQDEIHAITFSPFNTVRDMENDLIQQIKVMALDSWLPMRTQYKKNGRTVLHIVGAQGKDLVYTNLSHKWSEDKKGWAHYLSRPIKAIEAHYDYPITPCAYSCPYKTICKPDPFRTPILLEESS